LLQHNTAPHSSAPTSVQPEPCLKRPTLVPKMALGDFCDKFGLSIYIFWSLEGWISVSWQMYGMHKSTGDMGREEMIPTIRVVEAPGGETILCAVFLVFSELFMDFIIQITVLSHTRSVAVIVCTVHSAIILSIKPRYIIVCTVHI
jgi:hypothetical protein